MKWLLAICCAASLHAAVIRGVVVENLTGKPLARAVVILQPIAGTPGDTRSMRANSLGGFEFELLAAGAYVLKASRKAFMPMEYGQKRWNSAGTPVVLRDEETAFLSVRLLRYSAIKGTILDENDIGLPDHEIAAYRLGSPPELIATAKTDDRGEYRLHGLEPGSYVVRTVGKQYEDGSYVPTYSREAAEMRNAHRVDLLAEQEVEHIDVRPAPGRLFTLLVNATTDPPGMPVTLTLASETGRKTLQSSEAHFTGLPPGDYEVYAEAPADPESGETLQAAYQRFSLTGDRVVSLLTKVVRPAYVNVGGAPSSDSSTVWSRRKDLAGTGKPMPLEMTRGRATIPPGRWELMLQPPAGYYVSNLFAPSTSRQDRTRFDGWNEVLVTEYTGIRFMLSGGPGSIRGVVKSGGDTVSGAPVYLEAWDATARKRVGELRAVRSDAQGRFQFDGLAPGAYRVLATFEYLNPEVETMDQSAQEISVTGHAEKALDVDLYVIR